MFTTNCVLCNITNFRVLKVSGKLQSHTCRRSKIDRKILEVTGLSKSDSSLHMGEEWKGRSKIKEYENTYSRVKMYSLHYNGVPGSKLVKHLTDLR